MDGNVNRCMVLSVEVRGEMLESYEVTSWTGGFVLKHMNYSGEDSALR